MNHTSETERPIYPPTNAVYRWRDMKVGETFFANGKRTKSISSQACVAARATGYKFQVWTVRGEDNKPIGAMIKRVS